MLSKMIVKRLLTQFLLGVSIYATIGFGSLHGQVDPAMMAKISQLTESTRELRALLIEAKNQLTKLNLENAKLVYQNKALNSASLNERQKERIVEAVRNATSVEEAKVLFETLQSAVGERKVRRSESLREAVSKPTTSMLLEL